MGPASTPKGLVLVVDDEPSVRALLSVYLTRAGWTCLTSEHPDQAIEILERHAVTHAIVDLHLGPHSGLDLIRRVGSSWPAVRIVAMTGTAGRTESALAAGAVALLSKPFGELEKIVEALEGPEARA